MTTVNIHLTFGGNCKEAFDFYRSVFGGDFEYVGTWGSMRQQPDTPAVSEHETNKIMHITLPISKETRLMGSDNLEAFGGTVVMGNNFAILVKADSKNEADKLFDRLADPGDVLLPMERVFWGSYYGIVKDQFGITWKISVDLRE